MISMANLIVDVHHIRLDHENIDKTLVLRVNKKFMDIMRSKTTFATMTFEIMDANKRIKVQIVFFDLLLLFCVFQ